MPNAPPTSSFIPCTVTAQTARILSVIVLISDHAGRKENRSSTQIYNAIWSCWSQSHCHLYDAKSSTGDQHLNRRRVVDSASILRVGTVLDWCKVRSTLYCHNKCGELWGRPMSIRGRLSPEMMMIIKWRRLPFLMQRLCAYRETDWI